MKKTFSISILLLLFTLSVVAAIPQQPITAEKKSAMHKLDPVDIFPQVQERSGKDRNRNNGSNTALAKDSSQSEPRTSKSRHSRRRHSSKEKLSTDLADLATSIPTPAIAANKTEPEPTASPAATPDSIVAVGETANNNLAPPPQTLAAVGNLPESGNGNRTPLLSLPIILALLVLVLIVLVLVFAKLIRYLRGPIV